MDQIWVIRALGAFFVLFGITIRLGYWKKLYWRSRRGGIYGYVPLGLLFIWYSFYDMLDPVFAQWLPAYYAVFGLLMFLALFFMLRPPAWVKPAWVTWVEKHPQKVLKAMAEEANDGTELESQVVSQESVDKWARKLANKK